MSQWGRGKISREAVDAIAQAAISGTIRRFEVTGSPIMSDGEQSKPSFATYCVHGAPNIEPDGIVIPLEDGHARQLPRLTAGPFRYSTYAAEYLSAAKAQTKLPVKQALISASALSLIYPEVGIAGYSRQEFLEDLVTEAEQDASGRDS
jgi:5-methyltetrahydropteroyltriglutamate--homocysteine methyltransferase